MRQTFSHSAQIVEALDFVKLKIDVKVTYLRGCPGLDMYKVWEETHSKVFVSLNPSTGSLKVLFSLICCTYLMLF